MVEIDIQNEIYNIWAKIAQNMSNASLDHIVNMATSTILSMFQKYCDQLSQSGKWTNGSLGELLYQFTLVCIAIYNNREEGASKLRYSKLLPMQIAHLINFLYHIRRIPCAGERGNIDLDLLAIYQTAGPDEGLYVDSETTLRQIVRNIRPAITKNDFAEVRQALRDIAMRAERCQNRDLIPVNNGIFDLPTGTLRPFSPDYVYLAKSRVNYNPQAQNVLINQDDGTVWDVESWMESLSDDPEIVTLLWQILGAILRPFVRWNKCAMFYSATGNNGKGTLCELMRNLCGEGRYASIPISAFSRDFLLEKLPEVMAIIVDENDVGTYLDKAANFKAVITNDVIQINRKNKMAIPFQFFGFMVQCLNEMPRIRDRSESIYRRCLIVPFDKCFTGKERKCIKNDYLHRPEVLEYVMYRVLNMKYYELSEPAACRNILDDYKVYNDPTRQWWDEVSDKFLWDLLPWKFLYELYKNWFKENNPSGKVASYRSFIDELRQIAEKDDTWMCLTTTDSNGRKKDKQMSPSSRITRNEPLGASVGYDWGSADRWRAGTHRGLVRRVPSQPVQAQNPAYSNPYANPAVMTDCNIVSNSNVNS